MYILQYTLHKKQILIKLHIVLVQERQECLVQFLCCSLISIFNAICTYSFIVRFCRLLKLYISYIQNNFVLLKNVKSIVFNIYGSVHTIIYYFQMLVIF